MEGRVVDEYKSMHKLAMQLFDHLKYLPHYGEHTWRPMFQRAFELFAKLWKFQQDNRSVLNNPAHYGLRRWEIGEIAAKIGQLYYHYYLRTGDMNYLCESYVFYDAVRSRRYFSDDADLREASAMSTKMRYVTRFAVVTILLGRQSLSATLFDELHELLSVYAAFAPPDLAEWQQVLDDFDIFSDKLNSVQVIGASGERRSEREREPETQLTPVAMLNLPSDEYQAAVPGPRDVDPADELAIPREGLLAEAARRSVCLGTLPKDASRQYELKEAILVSCNAHQATLGEITVDTLRMLKALEHSAAGRSSPSDIGDQPASGRPLHKLLLYRPSAARMLSALSAAVSQTVATGGALLLYVSAPTRPQLMPGGGGEPALILAPRGAVPGPAMNGAASEGGTRATTADGVLLPSDIQPFLRVPALVVLDGPGCGLFDLPTSLFAKPVVALASGHEEVAEDASGASGGAGSTDGQRSPRTGGRVLTHFLLDPVLAFCALCNISTVQSAVLDALRIQVSARLTDVLAEFSRDDVHPAWRALLTDGCASTLAMRFLLCRTVLANCAPPDCRPWPPSALPTASPPIPPRICEHRCLLELVHNLVGIAGGHWSVVSAPSCSSKYTTDEARQGWGDALLPLAESKHTNGTC